jgi:Family of unknown function (DUF6338)
VTLDFFFFQLAIIFLPGLIWERIVAKYALKRPPTTFETGLRTFTFGLTSYMATFALFFLIGIEVYLPEVKKDAPFIVEARYLKQFVVAIAVSLVGSIVWLYILNYRWGGWFLRAIRATKKYGDEDVWDFAFNSPAAWSEYVYVRDHENDKVFSGWVVSFSQTGEVRELLLRDTEVFDLEGKKLYDTPLIYLGRAPDSIDIEFPAGKGSQANGPQPNSPTATPDR